jgi:hypothetical protein
MKHSAKIALLASAAALLPTLGMATTLGAWNLDNVVESTLPEVEGVTDFSVIYQGDPATAETNGRIAYTPPEAIGPGLIALNDFYTTGPGDSRVFDGCIRASVGGADCATGFQTGNRFKLQLTDTGAVDLVFSVNPDDPGTQGLNPGNPDEGPGIATPGINTYQVFGRAVNLTTKMLDSFVIELGYGIGDGFTASTANDGLRFAPNLNLGPNGDTAFTQYPFGLFGSLSQPNPNPLALAGFFDTNARAGFDLIVNEDSLVSDGYYGTYDDIFGNWLSQEMAPEGLLWDYASGAADPLVMAWDNGTEWEVRRGIDDSLDGILGTITEDDVFSLDPADWATYAYGDIAGVQAFLSGIPLLEDAIEDVANLNLNFGIELADTFMGFGNGLGSSNTFTLRFTSFAAAPVSPVPLPASVAFLLMGVGALGAARRFRKGSAA